MADYIANPKVYGDVEHYGWTTEEEEDYDPKRKDETSSDEEDDPLPQPGDMHVEFKKSSLPKVQSCNALNSMCQVSASYSPSLPCHLLVCCILSCHHVHFILHTCSSHASEHFPRCPFCNPALLFPPAFPFSFPVVSGY